MSKNVVKDKSFAFAIRIVNLYRYLVEKKEFVLSKQLLHSGTAVGALIRESEHAESKADFIPLVPRSAWNAPSRRSASGERRAFK